nr:hypothetical protein [uncultured Bacillus sp.]
MTKIRTVRIDGEQIHVFNSALYIFESSKGHTLELEMIVSEVVLNKYLHEENLIIEIELEDDRVISSIMYLKTFAGGLPQLNLYCELDEGDLRLYQDFDMITEYDLNFPNIEEGITLEEIRKVEMPDKNIKLKVKLPIDQCEWLELLEREQLNEIIKEMIDDYWKKR